MMSEGDQLRKAADQFLLDDNFAEAEKRYDALLTQNHDNPSLLASLGTLYIKTQKYGLAISLLHRVAEKHPKHSELLCNLGIAYKYTGQYEKSMKYFERAMEHDPTANTVANYAALFTNTGTPDKALSLSKRAIDLDPGCTMAHWNMAMALLETSQFDKGWDEMEWGFDANMRIRRVIKGAPYWDGTEGKTIHVYGEQGLGDEIMFASMLPDLMKNNTVILECHPRLKTLFKNSFPGLIVYGTREDTKVSWPDDHEIDYSVSIGSLGKFYRRSKESFPGTPYIKADSAPRGEKFRVGISWTGGMKQGRIRTRSVPLPWWKTILNNDCEFVSLQYTDCSEEIKLMRGNGYDIKEYDEIKAQDYNETAKIVKSCDLVISVCTSVIHLAGAMGVPTWVMVPKQAAWRYGTSGPMPFYRSVRLYRQPDITKDSWMPVVQKVGYDLAALGQKARKYG